MKTMRGTLLLGGGLMLGLLAGWLLFSQSVPALVANDRYQDYILATGPVAAGPVSPDLDGVWLLDYRAGKLLGTVVNRATGKITGFVEADLVKEFGIPPRADCHFLMTTGKIGPGQSVLYVAEVNSGRLGVYSLAMNLDGQNPGAVQMRRHDMVFFRAPPPGPKAEAKP
ncbi:MAG: hypothetical protein NZM31_01770 [Gemmatales bacterium]|nr:hypothetical protein [Gemmatales bacterium]MDW8385725.1 hypothetical protein [Gemmatales bacterium]